MMEEAADVLAQLLANRYSCRAFLPQPVEQPVLDRILSMAQRTATWCNTQPWKVFITSGDGTERLRELLYRNASSGVKDKSDLPWPREYCGVYLERRRKTGFSLYTALGIARDDGEGRTRQLLENFRLFGAPHLAVITTDEALGVYGAVDCGAYIANFLLAAQACGVNAVAQAALAQYSGVLREYFDLPPDRQVVCGISFGYADGSHKVNSFRTERASVSDAVTWVDA
jgi:nitroreductase